MITLLNFDEIHQLTVEVYEDAVREFPEDMEKRKKKVCDDVLEMLVYAYMLGMFNADKDLQHESHVDKQRMYSEIFQPIAGKNFEDRIREYVDGGQIPEIVRVVETDSHRMFNSGEVQSADQYVEHHPSAHVMKTWRTMLDPRVRDTHDYLEGRTIPYSDLFYTYNGDSAFAPGWFGIPEEDINCRCMLRLSVLPF